MGDRKLQKTLLLTAILATAIALPVHAQTQAMIDARQAYIDARTDATGAIGGCLEQIGEGPFDTDENGNPLGEDGDSGDLEVMFQHYNWANWPGALSYIGTHEQYRTDTQQIDTNLSSDLYDPDPNMPQINPLPEAPHHSKSSWASQLYYFWETPADQQECINLYNSMATKCVTAKTLAAAKHLLVEVNRLNELSAYNNWQSQQGGY